MRKIISKRAWQKKLQVGSKQIFDHDYPTEMVQKQRAYKNIKNVLGEGNLFPDAIRQDVNPLEQRSEDV